LKKGEGIVNQLSSIYKSLNTPDLTRLRNLLKLTEPAQIERALGLSTGPLYNHVIQPINSAFTKMRKSNEKLMDKYYQARQNSKFKGDVVVKRSEYDNPRQQFGGFGGQHNGQNFDFDSIFSMFGTQFQNPHARRAQRAQMTLWITLTDVAKGGNRTVSVGTQHGTHAVEIDIPKGINDGDNIQYQGIGPGGMDMIVTYRIHPDPRFVRQHLNLHTEQTVSIWDLILGCDLPVRDILGNEFSMVVPARTQPGTILRLKGKGLPSRAGVQGDLMIKLQARIPNDISPELIEQITQNHSQ
jgi:DnaJ-class molecular chaperone